jgi:serine/threonine-protein phosphatase PP1 catalytic subunit
MDDLKKTINQNSNEYIIDSPLNLPKINSFTLYTSKIFDIELDDFIKKCYEFDNLNLCKIKISENFVKMILTKVRSILMSQPFVLEINSPIKVCGDLHGQLYDLIYVFKKCGFVPNSKYLFLGDYVDRGKHGIETICLLFALKIKYPNKIFLLRGNHEVATINTIYGFFDECKRKFNVSIWKIFNDVFNCLPICAIINNLIFCCHGGLSPEIMRKCDMEILKNMIRPVAIADEGMLCDILWSDPENIIGWKKNMERGVSYCFGNNIIEKFLDNHGFDIICRGHQIIEEGYSFFCDRQLITIFTARDYCGEFTNHGAVMNIDEKNYCSFTILKSKIYCYLYCQYNCWNNYFVL